MDPVNTPADLPCLIGFRYPNDASAFAVWAYHRFALRMARFVEVCETAEPP